jgi:hypothetical protein
MSLGMDKTSLHPILPEVSFQALVADSLAVPNKIIKIRVQRARLWSTPEG